MSDIRFNQWLHQSGTGGVTQLSSGHVGIGTTNPLIPVHSGNNAVLNVGVVTANNIYAGTLNGTLALSDISGITGSFTSNLTVNGPNLDISDKIRHIGDTDTAIRFPLNDTISFETSGNERLRINSVGNVCIGGADATPSNAAYNGSTLHLYQPGSSSVGSEIKFSTGASGHTASDGAYMAFYSDNNMYCNIRESGHWQFYTSNLERFRIHSDGAVTKPANPSFRATAGSSLDYTSDNTIQFSNERHDIGGNYNNSNSYYTIPTTGYWKFEVMHYAQPGQVARVQLESSTDGGSNWSTIQIGPRIESSGGGRYIAGWMHVYHEFTATNIVRVRWSQGNVHVNNGYAWFQGWLMQ